MTIDEIRHRIGQLDEQIRGLNEEHEGRELRGRDKAAWNELVGERDDLARTAEQLKERHEYLAALAADPSRVESSEPDLDGGGSTYNPALRTRDPIFGSAMHVLEREVKEHDKARSSFFGSGSDDAIERQLRDNDPHRLDSSYIAACGDPAYKSAFRKAL